jgi:hypothetical protein
MYLAQLSTISASITAFQAFAIVTTTWQVFRTWNLQDIGRGVSDLLRSETNILWAPTVTPRAEKDQCLSYDIMIVTFLFWHFLFNACKWTMDAGYCEFVPNWFAP